MPEILTESFCERCGTRYTFESAAPRSARLKGVKTFSRGLKNFVMSDDTSMDEAMAAARSETDREVTSQQLDAFHKTFNFCMNCRQYTCGNCWNEADGQCLSCAPHLGHEIMPAPFPDLPIGADLAFPVEPAATNGHDAEAVAPLAWPTSDLMREPEPEPAPEPIVEPAASFDDTPLPRFDESADAGPISSATEPVEEIDAAARLAVLGALGASSRPEPVVAAPEPVVEPQPEPVVAAEPEPVAATAAEPELIPASAPEPVIEAGPRAPGPSRLDQEDVPGRAAAAAGQTTDLLHRFRPGQSLDDEIAAFEREQALAEAPEPVIAPEPVVAATPEPEPVIAPEPVVAATPEPEPVIAPEPVVAATPEPEPVIAPEPVVAATPEPEPVIAPEPVVAAIGIAAVAASPAVDPLAPAAMAPTFPATEAAPAEPAPAPATPRVDVVPQPTWQMVAPEPATAAPATPPVATPPPNTEPQWPSQPEWPSQQAAHAAFLGANARNSSLDSLWAEFAREVAAATPAVPMAPTAGARPSGVQPCISCGLSLSASARFCRRCGSRQG